MWVRMKGTGQEINVPDARAQFWIDTDEAVAIKTPIRPQPAATVAKPLPPALPLLWNEPFYHEARELVYNAGLPLATVRFVMRFLALEAKVVVALEGGKK